MRAKSSADRENLTAEEWRARARCLREFALSVLDDRTFQRMEQQAQKYDQMAALADLDAPQPAAVEAQSA